MARRVNMHLDEEFAAQIEAQKPKSLALAAFCALLIEQALDRGGEMANNLEQPGQAQAACSVPELLHPPVSLSPRQEKQSKTTAFEAATLPAELEAVRQTFVRFGKVKKGDRGEHGAKLAATGLKKIGEKYGWAVATEQLDLAINNRWAGISLSNYEKFLPKAAAKEPEHRHPASRVFTADKGFDDGPTTNPILKDLF
jgi:hypothetical protein